MKALITGATGFAGQYLVEHLLDCGDEVVGATYRAPWRSDVPDVLRRQVPLIEWNLAEPTPAAVHRQVAEWSVDWVFHLAAVSVPAECGGAQPSPLALAVNVGGTRAVLELAWALDRRPRVLVISSSHVYAPVPPDRPRVAEDAPLGPTGAYGITKLQGEQLCREAAHRGLDVIVARAFQHAGPRQLPKFMLPEWIAQFVQPDRDPIHVVTLDSHNDLSDVRDVVRAYRALLARPDTRGTFNVGSGMSVRSGDVFDRLVQLTGRPRHAVEQSPGRRQNPIADISRITTQTGWTPRIPLEQTLLDTLADFQSPVG